PQRSTAHGPDHPRSRESHERSSAVAFFRHRVSPPEIWQSMFPHGIGRVQRNGISGKRTKAAAIDLRADAVPAPKRSSAMSTVTNYDGSITATPQVVVKPKTIGELQDILKNTAKYPGPVRAMGNFHSLTPCAASGGTIVEMRGLNKVLKIDRQAMTFTAEAGLQMIEANEALQKENLQLMLNIEIGNMTLGSAACCHSKDSLDGVEFGQVNSYLVGVKWVTPAGELAEASAAKNPELLPKIRASYGLAGIVYEVTLRIKPLEIIRFNYHVHQLASLTQDDVTQAIATNDS